jgi:hypothetical protein
VTFGGSFAIFYPFCHSVIHIFIRLSGSYDVVSAAFHVVAIAGSKHREAYKHVYKQLNPRLGKYRLSSFFLTNKLTATTSYHHQPPPLQTTFTMSDMGRQSLGDKASFIYFSALFLSFRTVY